MSVMYIKNSNYWTFFHTQVKTVNSKQLTVKKMSKNIINIYQTGFPIIKMIGKM